MSTVKYYAKKKENGSSSSTTNYYSTNRTSNVTVTEAKHAAEADHASTADYAATAGYATNAESANQLTSTHTLWGQDFNGTQDVSGDITGAVNISASGDITGDDITGASLTSTGDLFVTKYSYIHNANTDNILPNTDNTYNLGSSSDYWANAYISHLYSDNITNKEKITTKDLTVTGSAHFFELIIDKIKAAGGAVLFTPADGFTIDIVESLDDHFNITEGTEQNPIEYYRLYWRAVDSDNNKRDNMWQVGDQAICRSFNQAKVGTSHDVSNKYYWAYVAQVSEYVDYNDEGVYYNYITISVHDGYYTGTVNPEIGDAIAMLGHRIQAKEYDENNEVLSSAKQRQSAIYIAAYESLDTDITAPLIAQYQGIDDFDLSSHRKSYFDANSAEFIGTFTVHTDDGDKNINEYITQLDSDIVKYTSEYASFNVNKDEINSNVNKYTEEYNKWTGTLETYTNEYSTFNQKADEISSSVTSISSQYDDMSERMDDVESGVETNYKNINSVVTRVSSIEQTADSITSTVGKNTYVFNSENIIPNIYSASDWVCENDENDTVKTDGLGMFWCKTKNEDNSNDISIKVSVTSGIKYNISLDGGNYIFDLYVNGWHTDITNYEYTATTTGTLTVEFMKPQNTPKDPNGDCSIYHPMIIPSTATDTTFGHTLKEYTNSQITQTAEEIKLSVNTDIESTGIDITNKKIKLTAENTEVDGSFTVQSVSGTGNGTKFTIQDGLLSVYGSNRTTPNIQFGVDDNGCAVLKYYDSAGNFLYDLGPNGIQYTTVREAHFVQVNGYYSSSAPSTAIFNTIKSKNLNTEYAQNCYTFYCQINAGVLDNDYKEYNEKIFDSDEMLDSRSPDTDNDSFTTGYIYKAVYSYTPETDVQFPSNPDSHDFNTVTPTATDVSNDRQIYQIDYVYCDGTGNQTNYSYYLIA